MPEGMLLAPASRSISWSRRSSAVSATARGERVRAGERQIEVAVVRITPKGREAIGASG
jgi:hypothetical protein